MSEQTTTISPVQKIMLVDDEPSVVFALKLLLQALGFTVYDFNQAIQGIEFLHSATEVDLCLCDLKMPKMNGIAVLKEVRKLRPKLPFVLMSAHADSDEVRQALDLGAHGFLSKPFSPEDLKQLLASIQK